MRFTAYKDSFTQIADYYDRLMSFVNYPAWIDYIESILKLNNNAQKIIFDLACGTGVCMEIWRQKQYKVYGLDRSMAMLNICRRRFQQLGIIDIPLINSDMRYFSLNMKYPVITCLYDSLNYLIKDDDFDQCIRRVYDCLEPDGIFIFDMNTIHCLRDEWGNNVYERHDDNIHSIWHNKYNVIDNISSLKITLNIQKNGQLIVLREHHQERGYALTEITQCLKKNGFQINMYRHLTYNPAQESDLRIMGVARKL